MGVDHWHHDCNVVTAWPLNCMWYTAVLQDGQRTVCTRALFRTDNPIYTLCSLPIHCCILLRGLKLSAIDVNVSMGSTTHNHAHVLGKVRIKWKRNGNGMETEWKWVEMEEMRGRKRLNWITIMPISMHSKVSEHWKDIVVPSATTLKFFARTITLQKKRTDTVMPCK